MLVSRVASRPRSCALYRVSAIKRDPFSLSWLDGHVIERERMAVYTSSLEDIMGRATGDKSISLLNNNNARGVCRGFATLSRRVSIRQGPIVPGKHFARFAEWIFSRGNVCFTSFHRSRAARAQILRWAGKIISPIAEPLLASRNAVILVVEGVCRERSVVFYGGILVARYSEL